MPNTPANAVIKLAGRDFVVLGELPTHPPQALVIDAGSGFPLLARHVGGTIGLPQIEALRSLSPPDAMAAVDAAAIARERMEAELQILEASRVPNGTKAIAIHLHANWTPELRARLGDFDDPASIKRWRTAVRRAAKRDGLVNGRPPRPPG